MDVSAYDRQVTDLETSLKRLAGDEKLLAKLAEFYLEDAPALMNQLLVAFRSRDYDVFERRLHSLKGLSATFEPRSLLKIISEIGPLARSRDEVLVERQLRELEQEFARVILNLQQVVQEVNLTA